MLVKMSELLSNALEAGTIVPAFNIWNLETAQAVLMASNKAGRPAILAFGAAYLSHASIKVISSMVRSLCEENTQPMALHLDHCRDLELIRQALDAGFTSVMYDGSLMPLEENIRLTKAVRCLADAYGASTEGEVGGLNREDGGEGLCLFTEPKQAARFVDETEVDALAVSVGNAHGVYHGAPHIEWERLHEIQTSCRVPLVLHGSSGIPAEDLRKAAALGVAKINVNTDISLAGASALRRTLTNEKKMERPMLAAREEIARVMANYFI